MNFWATWCGPCLTEFPEIEKTWRMFRRRDFDLVTVAANLPDERAGVMRILQQEHASGRNLMFGTEDTYGLQAAFEPKWEGGVPFTMVIAPGGKVIFPAAGRGGCDRAAPHHSGASGERNVRGTSGLLEALERARLRQPTGSRALPGCAAFAPRPESGSDGDRRRASAKCVWPLSSTVTRPGGDTLK